MRKTILILAILLGTILAKGQSLKGYELGTVVKVVADWTTVGGVRGLITGNTTQKSNSRSFTKNNDILYYINFKGLSLDSNKDVSFAEGIIEHYKLDIKVKENEGFKYTKDHVVYEVTVKERDMPNCYDVSFSMLDLEAKAKDEKLKKKLQKEALENDY
ncbi:hypothetical protein [Ancylomarina sp. 16SWW S1-10-2]|uniref:hypothetical protein n=1 Tax=Ancylomarina sp. 16SWW S1-10-2 TaxID=2499681 RepID=UPI0012AD5EE3|nr:hypothetical protein [Ancylomarina sp. 16SWW S1-10-2]MRT93303.1 hypothetical protein [Ancylomarina sp. 16SWW S1-10-2]